jgi:hypothetical protein
MRAAVVTAVVLAACAGAAAASTAGRPVGELRDCGSRGEGTSPQKLPTSAGVRIGPLVFWPSIRTRQTGRANNSAMPFVIKAPVVLPAGAKVVLSVAPEAVGRAGFQHAGRYVSAVRFEACSERVRARAYDGTVGKLTGFPFAIGLTQRSACIPMELWLDGRDTPLRRVVPVGRSSC